MYVAVKRTNAQTKQPEVAVVHDSALAWYTSNFSWEPKWDGQLFQAAIS